MRKSCAEQYCGPTTTASSEVPLTEQEAADKIQKNAVATSVDIEKFLNNYPIFKKHSKELNLGGRADVYTFHLHYAGETDLATVGVKKGEAYRLITMDGGARASTIYRIEKLNDQITLTTKKVDTIGLYNGLPADVDISPPRKLNDKEWFDFQTQLDRVSYWSLPTGNSVFGLDGAFYLVEGVTPTKHHLVARWNEIPASYRELFDYLAGLSENAAFSKENSTPPAVPGQ